jgi:hypothetical protein
MHSDSCSSLVPVAAAIGQYDAILDGDMVALDPARRAQFYFKESQRRPGYNG